ncbi:antibiotic biosynthesis monooxygenase [Microbulbifer sp. TYP-18]|uniref:antibiotic biosynthesis monooxygenase n=1 Tax=Microbulbifer sp. TYP-18 TaxID=3230024 RepID=UPI0034C68A92
MMARFEELNDKVSLADQMQTNEDGSIVLINVFTIDPADGEALLAAWKHDADFMRAQPGYISTQLHKAIGGSGTFVNYAIWESVESFRNAFTNPEFQKRIGGYPESAVASPHLFKKLAVSGHCVA